MKKVIVLLALVIALVLSINPGSSWLANKGFREKKGSLAFNAGRIKMRIWNHRDAIRIFNRALLEFPQHDRAPTARYWLALCYENNREPEKAMAAYEEFIRRHPDHTWNGQAAKRQANLEANQL